MLLCIVRLSIRLLEILARGHIPGRKLWRSQRVHPIGLGDHVKDQVDVVLVDMLLLYQVLHLEWVKSHCLALFDQFLLLAHLILVQLFVWIYLAPERERLCNLFPLVIFRGSRKDLLRHEEAGKLPRHLLESLFC